LHTPYKIFIKKTYSRFEQNDQFTNYLELINQLWPKFVESDFYLKNDYRYNNNFIELHYIEYNVAFTPMIQQFPNKVIIRTES